MWILYLITTLLVPSIQGASHPASPCPRVFFYEGAEPERDRWYGAVLLSTEESLVGVRLDIKLDRPSQILVSWMGDVTSEDNQSYTVLSLSQKLHPGPPLHSRFMVKFDARHGIPQVRTIRLNGRQICPPDPNFPVHHSNEGHSENGYSTERSTKRPDPVFPPPVVDLSPVRPAVKTTTEHYYSDIRGTTKRYNYEEDYSPHKQTNKNNYYNYEQENAVTQRTTTSNYNQGIHNSERPNFSYSSLMNRPDQYGDTDDSPPHEHLNEKHIDSDDNRDEDSHGQTKATTRKPVVQNTNSNNNSKYNNNSNQQTTTYRSTVTSSYSNNQKVNSSNNQPPKTVKKPEPSGVNSGSRVVTTRNIDAQKTTPYSSETSTQRIDVRSNGASDAVNQYSSNRPNQKNSSTRKPSTATTSRYYQSAADDLESASSDVKCGRVQIPPVPLITNGQNTARGQWPWHIALYVIQGEILKYICGGSLISNIHVVTAAHCVTKEGIGIPLPAEVLVVYLGKYHLSQFSDDGGIQNKQVREIHVLPQFNSSTYTGDIAVLELSSPVEFTPYVRPVCLWDPDETELSVIEGKVGTVVGWGLNEFDQVSQQLKMAKMPVVSQEVCIRSYPEFFSRSTTNKTYCAGFRNGTSVCNGDSGGGMVFYMDGTWYLRGVVSTAVSRKDANLCDTYHYVVFVDAAKYLQWIQQFIT